MSDYIDCTKIVTFFVIADHCKIIIYWICWLRSVYEWRLTARSVCRLFDYIDCIKIVTFSCHTWPLQNYYLLNMLIRKYLYMTFRNVYQLSDYVDCMKIATFSCHSWLLQNYLLNMLIKKCPCMTFDYSKCLSVLLLYWLHQNCKNFLS